MQPYRAGSTTLEETVGLIIYVKRTVLRLDLFHRFRKTPSLMKQDILARARM